MEYVPLHSLRVQLYYTFYSIALLLNYTVLIMFWMIWNIQFLLYLCVFILILNGVLINFLEKAILVYFGII
jgi:hypothetical protein